MFLNPQKDGFAAAPYYDFPITCTYMSLKNCWFIFAFSLSSRSFALKVHKLSRSEGSRGFKGLGVLKHKIV